MVLQPLEDNGTLLYPEPEAYLQTLPRLGTPIVVTKGSRGPSRPYAMVYAQARVRQARVAVGLGAHVTLDACRHGGMTELGDAELVEQGVMALSGHKTPQAARLYMKRTEAQRIAAARKIGIRVILRMPEYALLRENVFRGPSLRVCAVLDVLVVVVLSRARYRPTIVKVPITGSSDRVRTAARGRPSDPRSSGLGDTEQTVILDVVKQALAVLHHHQLLLVGFLRHSRTAE